MAFRGPVQTIQSQSPSTNIFAELWNDFLRLLAFLTGRTLSGTSLQSPSAQTAVYTQSPTVPVVSSSPITQPITIKPTISVLDAVHQAIATETNINPAERNGWMSDTGSNWQLVIVQLHKIYLDPSECGGSPAPDLTLQEASAGVSAAGVGAGLLVSSAAIPVLGAAVAGAQLLIGAIQSIFTHHAQAVQRDIRAQCSLIPAANNALNVIIEGVKSGQVKAADAVAALQQLPQIFLQQAGAAKNNSPYCNGVCGNLIVLRAICFYWVSQFQSGAYA
jgi:hypothetical protein